VLDLGYGRTTEDPPQPTGPLRHTGGPGRDSHQPPCPDRGDPPRYRVGWADPRLGSGHDGPSEARAGPVWECPTRPPEPQGRGIGPAGVPETHPGRSGGPVPATGPPSPAQPVRIAHT